MSFDKTALEQRLGYQFADAQLLLQALTHSSFKPENSDPTLGNFERLEFLGDAVLDLALAELLMSNDPSANEGKLSKWRASLVNENSLAEVALNYGIDQHLRLGKGEKRDQERRPSSRLLASCFEALVGAIHRDGGWIAARSFVEVAFQAKFASLSSDHEFVADYKSRLQEIVQKKYKSLPEYQLTASSGPDHNKIFTCEVRVQSQLCGRGEGPTRKAAEQAAAAQALKGDV